MINQEYIFFMKKLLLKEFRYLNIWKELSKNGLFSDSSYNLYTSFYSTFDDQLSAIMDILDKIEKCIIHNDYASISFTRPELIFLKQAIIRRIFIVNNDIKADITNYPFEVNKFNYSNNYLPFSYNLAPNSIMNSKKHELFILEDLAENLR